MTKIGMISVVGALCTVGVLGCGSQGGNEAEPSQTLTFNRLASGELEYCDEDGACQTLPYQGECVALEIAIDLRTGESCQRCIREDGSVVDQGCATTVVACTVVTAPEPDCVVCAYVNGAIVYSTCVAAEPVCSSDRDCASMNAMGRCVDGQCIASPTCESDRDCPEGFVCQPELCPAFDCMDDTECLPVPCQGASCVPAPIECGDDRACPSGMVCTQYCTGGCPPNERCEDVCTGVCEVAPETCESDDECGPGMACMTSCAPCDPSMDYCTGLCVGTCVYVDPPLECTNDFQCQYDGFGPGLCWNGQCLYAFDCDASHAACDAAPPRCASGQVPTVLDGCYGPCVDAAWCEAPAVSCVVSGCSGEICASEPMFSTCDARPADACYDSARCEVQADGQCGWTQTEGLTECIAAAER